MNFLEETIDDLKDVNKFPKDVLFISDGKVYYFWQDFAINANFEYDEGYGGVNIYSNLVIVGSDWWLERHEYDGAEWWEYKSLPIRPLFKGIPKLKE